MARVVELELSVFQVTPKTHWTFVALRDSEGRQGWGEATLTGRERELADVLPELAALVLGQPLGGHAQRTAQALRTTQSLPRAAMLSALDHALWDLDAQRHAKSLAEMLGTVRRSAIGLYANINRGTVVRTPGAFAKRALEAQAAGFDAIKIAPFDGVTHYGRSGVDDGGVRAGWERMAAVREAVGPECELMVDCHWRLNELLARATIDVAAKQRFRWVECPLPESAAHLAQIATLRAHAHTCGVLLAGCEEAIGTEGFRPFVEAGAYDVMMPDVKYVGGLAEVLRVADYLGRHGIEFSPHNPSGPIAHAVSLHVCAVAPTLRRLETQFRETPMFEQLVAQGTPVPHAGLSPVPLGPGLGLALASAGVLATRTHHQLLTRASPF